MAKEIEGNENSSREGLKLLIFVAFALAILPIFLVFWFAIPWWGWAIGAAALLLGFFLLLRR